MIPNCDLSRENLSAGFSTRSDIHQHVTHTLEISDLESREILINKNKRLCNELILIFYLAHCIFSRPHSDLRALMAGEGNQARGKGSAEAPCWSWAKVWSGVPLGTTKTSDCIHSRPDAVNPVIGVSQT